MFSITARVLLVAAASVLVTQARAQDAVREDNKEAVESLLAAAEEAAGRAFDASFREQMHRRLGGLSEEELAGRRQRVRTSGLGEAAVPGDATADLVFTPVTPCRLADTRSAGGSLAVGAPRPFRVTGFGLNDQGGAAAGCGIPFGPATAAVINFVAVNPTGAGNLRAWAYSTPQVGPPNASIVNYAFLAGSGLNIANAVVVPLCSQPVANCPNDLLVQADGSGVQLVMDVVGYFHRFATERVRTQAVVARFENNVVTPTTCQSLGSVTFNAPVPGTIIVHVMAGFTFGHQAGAQDFITANVSATVGDCTLTYRWLQAPETPTSLHQNVASFFKEFSVPAGNHTFHLNAFKGGSALNGDFFFNRALLATFYPN